MDKNCLNCKWALDIDELDTIKLCGCLLSGCYHTDVTAYECCDKWELRRRRFLD